MGNTETKISLRRLTVWSCWGFLNILVFRYNPSLDTVDIDIDFWLKYQEMIIKTKWDVLTHIQEILKHWDLFKLV
jgi:hypothetical protein